MIIAIVGKGKDCNAHTLEAAEVVGRMVAQAGHTVLTGGLGGVMEAAAKGAHSVGGTVLGIVPEEKQPNPYVTVCVRSGMTHVARNVIIGTTADAMIAMHGSHGTLQELAVALDRGIPVVACETDKWERLGIASQRRYQLAKWLIDLTVIRAADVVMLSGTYDAPEAVLLVKRTKEPFLGQWAIPGGKIEGDESPHAAAARELREETGVLIDPSKLRFFKRYDTKGRDPRGDSVSWVFTGWLADVETMTDKHELPNHWWRVAAVHEELDGKPLAFDHGDILRDVLKANARETVVA